MNGMNDLRLHVLRNYRFALRNARMAEKSDNKEAYAFWAENAMNYERQWSAVKQLMEELDGSQE